MERELLEGDMKVNLKHVDCKEDNDFMSAFDRMMAESILERTSNIPKAGQFDISVPVHVKSTTKKTYGKSVSVFNMHICNEIFSTEIRSLILFFSYVNHFSLCGSLLNILVLLIHSLF